LLILLISQGLSKVKYKNIILFLFEKSSSESERLVFLGLYFLVFN